MARGVHEALFRACFCRATFRIRLSAGPRASIAPAAHSSPVHFCTFQLLDALAKRGLAGTLLMLIMPNMPC